jgi:hypothetical protein
MMEATRKAAIAKGDAQYFTGKACQHGHVAPRRATNGECLVCRAERLKAWRIENPTKVQQHNKTQYSRFAEKIKAASRKYHAENVDVVNAKKRAYQKTHLHIYAKIKAKRHAAELKRTPAWLTEDDHWLMEQAYELAALRTKLFGISFQVDHVLPLQGKLVSGLHVPLNLQVIPAKMNRAKSNSFEVI